MRFFLAALALLGAYAFTPAAEAQPGGCPFYASACQVKATGGTRAQTLAAFEANTIQSNSYAFNANAVYNDTITVSSTNGSPIVAITGQAFTSADVGKLITVGLIGGGGSPVSTTIVGVSGSNVTIGSNALTTYAGASYVVFGTDDAATLQTMMNNVPAAGGTARVAAGSYLVSAVTSLNSLTRVVCDPGATFYMLNGWNALSSHWIFANAHRVSSVLIDHDITVEGCSFNGSTLTPSTGADGLRWTYITNARTKNNTFNNFGDAIAHIGTLKTVDEGNQAYNITNTCWDFWDAVHELVTRANYCETYKHGIQITGTDSTQTSAGISAHGQLIDERIVLLSNSNVGAGFWLNSGALSNTGAGTQYVTIMGGQVTAPLGGGDVGDCVKMSGSGTKYDTVYGLSCDNSFIYVGPSDVVASAPTDLAINGATVVLSNTLTGGAIQIKCTQCGVMNSRVTGGGYQYAIDVQNANAYALNNILIAGTGARINVGSSAKSTLTATDTSNISGTFNFYDAHAAMQLVGANLTTSTVVPTTGQSVTVADATGTYIVNPAGTLAALTVTMPAAGFTVGEICDIVFNQAITSGTISANSGQTINGAAVSATSIAANAVLRYKWTASNTWWRLQ